MDPRPSSLLRPEGGSKRADSRVQLPLCGYCTTPPRRWQAEPDGGGAGMSFLVERAGKQWYTAGKIPKRRWRYGRKPDFIPEFVEENELKVTVPDLVGASYISAAETLRKLRLTAVACPSGNEEFEVIDQYPKAGDQITVGNSVCLYSQ